MHYAIKSAKEAMDSKTKRIERGMGLGSDAED